MNDTSYSSQMLCERVDVQLAPIQATGLQGEEMLCDLQGGRVKSQSPSVSSPECYLATHIRRWAAKLQYLVQWTIAVLQLLAVQGEVRVTAVEGRVDSFFRLRWLLHVLPLFLEIQLKDGAHGVGRL
jgi:hypothetical protein